MLIVIGGILGLFALLWLGLELGRYVARRHRAGGREGYGAVEGAVFALLGLLLAFTFSGAAGRFDARRQLIINEANAVGTAYLRLDLLPAASGAQLRQLFGQYLDARMAEYRRLATLQNAAAENARVEALEGAIWAQALAGCKTAEIAQAPQLVLPALNEMFDLREARMAAVHTHLPGVIVVLLVILEFLSALIAGYGMAGRRSWLHMLSFAAILAITTYIIIDYEFPRFGLIRVDAFDQELVELRAGMP